jgi:hypothetical protein
MIPDRYTTEKMAHEHRQTLLREAEYERMLAIVDPPKHVLQGFADKLGRYLLLLGTRLQQFERRGEVVMYPSKSR